MVSSKEISNMLAARRENKLPKEKRVEKKIETGKKCPECGIQNKDNAKFCVGCGKSMEEKEVQIKPLNIKEKGNMKICPSCKSEIPENAKFCVVCGETQPSVETEGQEVPKIEKKKILDLPKEDEKIELSTPLADVSSKLVIQELILDEDGIKLNNIVEIEGLGENELINYNNIKDIELKDEIIEIDTTNGSITIKGVDSKSANEFILSIQEKVKEAEPEIDPESMDKIQKAKELLDIGAIDEEEFEKIKRKIIEDI